MPPKKKRVTKSQKSQHDAPVTVIATKMSTRSGRRAGRIIINPNMEQLKAVMMPTTSEPVPTNKTKSPPKAKPKRVAKLTIKQKKSEVMTAPVPETDPIETILIEDDDERAHRKIYKEEEGPTLPIEEVFIQDNEEIIMETTDIENIDSEASKISDQLQNLHVATEQSLLETLGGDEEFESPQGEIIEPSLKEETKIDEIVEENANSEEVEGYEAYEHFSVEYVTEEFVPVVDNAEEAVEAELESIDPLHQIEDIENTTSIIHKEIEENAKIPKDVLKEAVVPSEVHNVEEPLEQSKELEDLEIKGQNEEPKTESHEESIAEIEQFVTDTQEAVKEMEKLPTEMDQETTAEMEKQLEKDITTEVEKEVAAEMEEVVTKMGQADINKILTEDSNNDCGIDPEVQMEETNLDPEVPIEEKKLVTEMPIEEMKLVTEEPIEEMKLVTEVSIEETKLDPEIPIEETQLLSNVPVHEKKSVTQVPIEETKLFSDENKKMSVLVTETKEPEIKPKLESSVILPEITIRDKNKPEPKPEKPRSDSKSRRKTTPKKELKEPKRPAPKKKYKTKSKKDKHPDKNEDKTEEVRRSSRIKSISVLKQRSRGHGLVKVPKPPLSEPELSESSLVDSEKVTDSPNLVAVPAEPENKPVKVKSRWRRSSELEMNVLTPAAVVMETCGDGEKIAEANEALLEKQKLANQEVEARLKQFVHLKENLYLTERMNCKEAKKMICDCFLTPEEAGRGEWGCGEDCLNRLLMIEW